MGEYDFEPRQAPSIYLKLQTQGDKVRVRLVSSPYREPKVWKENVRKPLDSDAVLALTEQQWLAMYREPEYNITEVFHWVVIDRESGQPKIYSGSPMIYKGIKKYAEMSDWGNPTTYDFQIERTEKPGSYYEVTALPNKEELTDKEQAQAAELIAQLSEKLPAARKVTEVQIDYLPSLDEKEDPQAEAVAGKKEDIVIEDIGGEPINLDNIPF